MRLQGKTAIITGAGSGFDAGIARKFPSEGARVDELTPEDGGRRI